MWQDFLISIKMLVLQRAKVIGHEDLAEKFDLKTLRAIGISTFCAVFLVFVFPLIILSLLEC